MTFFHHTRRLAWAALALPLAVGGTSLAQPQGPGPHGMGEHGMPMHEATPMHGGRGMGHGDPAAHAQMLQDILQLRPDQEPALKALMDAMGPPQAMTGPADDMAGATTPQRLERMLARMDERRARMARGVEAVKRFYAQLTPAQQRAFDALHSRMGHGMGMGMGGGRMMMMRHMEAPGSEGQDMGMPGMGMPDMGTPETGQEQPGEHGG